MMSSGSTTFFLDFDIFSIDPMVTGPWVFHVKRLPLAALRGETDIGRRTQAPASSL